MKNKKLLAIDPGLSGTGWAIFSGKKLADFGVLTFRDNEPWERRGQMYADSIFTLFYNENCDDFAIEFPGFFESAAGTMVAKTGDLAKLTYLVGLICGTVQAQIFIRSFKLVPVHEWKGQLPKSVVNERIKKILGEKTCEKIKSHAFDAVGIGLHCLGFAI